MKILNDHIGIHSDQDIIDLVLGGNLPIYEMLIRRYNPLLYKIARSYGFNHQDAEDLMQDTHVAAFVHLEQFEKRSSYKTWISRIMINACIRKLQYGYFKNEIPSEIMEEKENLPTSASGENPTEDQVTNRELSVVLEKSLMEIPLMYRMVFVLRIVEEFSTQETASFLGITTTNVKARLLRARSLLQKQIERSYTHSEFYSFNLIYCDAIVQRVFEKVREKIGKSME